MSYIKDNFLLTNQTAEKLYFDYAAHMPIFDYHCHLPERQILENHPFNDIFEVWLSGDHYKWRLMRNCGVDEEYITGNKSNKERFVAYCKTVGTAFGNPLYHWSQMELETFFDCKLEINAENAEAIWDECNAYIKAHEVTPQSLIEKSHVSYIFTTNEVFDDLLVFEKIAQKNYAFKVTPAYRADKMIHIEAEKYNEYIDLLEGCTHKIQTLDEFEWALELRLKDFIRAGAKASDVSLEEVYPIADRNLAASVFLRRRRGEPITEVESKIFKGYMSYFLFAMYGKYKIVSELHLGVTRNQNTTMFKKLGPDTGFDCISDAGSIKNLSRLFDSLNNDGVLPKTILFNLNPKMNPEIMSLLGCFQSGETKGKIQFGPAWWFLDNKVGMEKHLEDLTATGHIATFVGMLTDSRSFLSYPRHHYFRRILCNYLGGLMERGEMTQNIRLVGKVVQDISYHNISAYLGIGELSSQVQHLTSSCSHK